MCCRVSCELSLVYVYVSSFWCMYVLLNFGVCICQFILVYVYVVPDCVPQGHGGTSSCMYAYMNVYICEFVPALGAREFQCKLTHEQTYILMYVCVYIYMYIYMHIIQIYEMCESIYIYVGIHIYIHTYMHTYVYNTIYVGMYKHCSCKRRENSSARTHRFFALFLNKLCMCTSVLRGENFVCCKFRRFLYVCLYTNLSRYIEMCIHV